MDHLVMSVGTFGWWAGYKCQGTVVYAKDFFTPGSHYAAHFLHNATDFFYPGWIGM
jgi:galactoside 2-L-fucosyltransferase 1/2